MEPTPAPRPRRRRRVLVLGLLASLALIGGLAYYHKFFVQRNFGVITPGLAYRSAQPGDELESTARRYRLGSILNLRAGSPADGFYRNELAVTERLGIDFYDLPLSASRRPSRHELLALLDVIARARAPLLIHCKSGADRTGLATAVYRMQREGMGPTEAIAAFTIAHGHVPLLGAQRLHDPIDEYADWLAAEGLEHQPERFRDWIRDVYRDGDPTGLDLPQVPTGPRYARRSQPPAGDQPASAGINSADSAPASASATSRVSTTRDATSQSSGMPRR